MKLANYHHPPSTPLPSETNNTRYLVRAIKLHSLHTMWDMIYIRKVYHVNNAIKISLRKIILNPISIYNIFDAFSQVAVFSSTGAPICPRDECSLQSFEILCEKQQKWDANGLSFLLTPFIYRDAGRNFLPQFAWLLRSFKIILYALLSLSDKTVIFEFNHSPLKPRHQKTELATFPATCLQSSPLCNYYLHSKCIASM